MRKNIRKLLAAAISLVLCLALLAGCGAQPASSAEEPKSEAAPAESKAEESKAEESKAEESKAEESKEEAPSSDLEPVTLKWYYDGTEGEGSADVIKVFNEKLQELLPNTTVDVVFVPEYDKNWPLLLAGGEQMDLAWNGWSTPMQADMMDGSLLALDDLIEQYAPNLVREREIWEAAYNTAKWDGQLWAIPSIQPTVPEAQALMIYDLMLPYVDMDALLTEVRTNFKCTENLLDIIENAYEAAIADGAITVGSDDWFINLDYFFLICKLGYMNFGPEGQRMYYDPTADKIEVKMLYELPEMKMVLDRMGEWYDKGWITETNILKQLTDSQGTIDVNASWNKNWANCDENGIYRDESGATYVMTNRPEEGYKGVSIFGQENTYMVIPYSAKYPERAMMLLNLLHDEVGTPGNDLYNLLCYGFEKNSPEAAEYGWYNYEAVEEDGQMRAVFVENTVHTMTNWAIGNTYKCLHDGGTLTTRPAKEYCMKYYTEIYPTLRETPVTGMVVDFSSIKLEQDAIKTVVNEYKPQLQSGSGGRDKVDALYQEFIDKCKEAGLDKVKEVLQAQVDAYVGG